MGNFAKGLGLGLLLGYAGIMTVGFLGMCFVVAETDKAIRNTQSYRKYEIGRSVSYRDKDFENWFHNKKDE